MNELPTLTYQEKKESIIEWVHKHNYISNYSAVDQLNEELNNLDETQLFWEFNGTDGNNNNNWSPRNNDNDFNQGNNSNIWSQENNKKNWNPGNSSNGFNRKNKNNSGCNQVDNDNSNWNQRLNYDDCRNPPMNNNGNKLNWIQSQKEELWNSNNIGNSDNQFNNNNQNNNGFQNSNSFQGDNGNLSKKKFNRDQFRNINFPGINNNNNNQGYNWNRKVKNPKNKGIYQNTRDWGQNNNHSWGNKKRGSSSTTNKGKRSYNFKKEWGASDHIKEVEEGPNKDTRVVGNNNFDLWGKDIRDFNNFNGGEGFNKQDIIKDIIRDVELEIKPNIRKELEDQSAIVERKSFKGMELELYGNKQNNDIEDGTKEVLEDIDMGGWEEHLSGDYELYFGNNKNKENILNHNADDLNEQQETLLGDNYKENLIEKENEDVRFLDSLLVKGNYSKDNYFENEEDKQFLKSITKNKNMGQESEEKEVKDDIRALINLPEVRNSEDCFIKMKRNYQNSDNQHTKDRRSLNLIKKNNRNKNEKSSCRNDKDTSVSTNQRLTPVKYQNYNHNKPYQTKRISINQILAYNNSLKRIPIHQRLGYKNREDEEDLNLTTEKILWQRGIIMKREKEKNNWVKIREQNLKEWEENDLKLNYRDLNTYLSTWKQSTSMDINEDTFTTFEADGSTSEKELTEESEVVKEDGKEVVDHKEAEGGKEIVADRNIEEEEEEEEVME